MKKHKKALKKILSLYQFYPSSSTDIPTLCFKECKTPAKFYLSINCFEAQINLKNRSFL